MPRGYQTIATSNFAVGWTGPFGGRGGAFQVAHPISFPVMDDVEVLQSGSVRIRPDLEVFLELGERIDYLEAISGEPSTWTLLVATPSAVRIYDLSASGSVVLRRQLPRSSDEPVTAVGYQGDIFFTLDRVGYFYDPETTSVYQIGLPKPASRPTATVTTEAAPIRGNLSYAIAYRRKVGSRYEAEGPLSDAVGVEVNGTAVDLTWAAPPSGLGITGVAIYRAHERMGTIGPYLLVEVVAPTVTSYRDKKDTASLGSAIFTLGREIAGGSVVSILLDHLMLADGDRVYIASPFRPETFRPGFDLAMDEGREPTGEVRALIPMRNRMAVLKRDAIYEIVVSGSPNYPFFRGLVLDGLGVDSPYGAISTTGLDLIVATPSTILTIGGERGEDLLGPLSVLYRELPEGIRRRVFLHYYPDRLWLLLALEREMWVRMPHGAWVRWTIPATAMATLVASGENQLIVGTADGRVGFLRGRSRSGKIEVRLSTSDGQQIIARRVALTARGHGKIGVRVGNAPVRFLSVSALGDGVDVVDTPVFERSDVVNVLLLLDGAVEIASFTVDGRAGRKIGAHG